MNLYLQSVYINVIKKKEEKTKSCYIKQKSSQRIKKRENKRKKRKNLKENKDLYRYIQIEQSKLRLLTQVALAVAVVDVIVTLLSCFI